MLKIAPADEGEDAAALVIERDDRPLQIFRRGWRLGVVFGVAAVAHESGVLRVGLVVVIGRLFSGVELRP